LVNAVARKVNRDPVDWPDPATALSCPAYLLTRWSEQFGADQAREIARAALSEPGHFVRIPPGSAPPEGVTVEPTDVAGCFRLETPSHCALRQQDIGSQSIVPFLDLQPGLSFLDLCAAPGNKTAQALETSLGLSVACDLSPRRAREIPAVCHRVVADASAPLPFGARFDRVLVDAPCSGTGTLGRNPEIKWRVQQQDFARFHKLQVSILDEALRQLAPGGTLVYATCSLEHEENEDVVRRVLHGHPARVCTRQARRMPGRDEGDGFYAAVVQ
jgi:16S rRNA (cytosine967-C5)-methyltransferase